MSNKQDLFGKLLDLYEEYKVETVIIAFFLFLMVLAGIAAIFVFLTMIIVLFFVSKPFSEKLKELCEIKKESKKNIEEKVSKNNK